jgi:hypothetical protein
MLIFFQMRVFFLMSLVVNVILIVIMISWNLPSNRMQLLFSVNSKDAEQVYQSIKDKRLRLSVEEFTASLEIIEDANFTAYVDLLLNQHRSSDKFTRDFIARIPFTEQSQQLFPSLSVGWHNSFSITLIAHQKFNDYHKVIIAKLSKEVTISLLDRILSIRTSIFGLTLSEQKQMEAILKNSSQERGKQVMEDMMMYTMADNLRSRFNDDVEIKFIQGNKTEL